MKIRTNVKAGGLDTTNHNEKLARDKKTRGLIVKTSIKAGSRPCPEWECGSNHNEKLASDKTVKSLRPIGRK
jgi:hypothetical protein